MEKTNVMRLLDQKKIPYTPYAYDAQFLDGVTVARQLGEAPERVFKTLVTTAGTGAYFVFVIPVAMNLDLKKAAKAVSVKSLSMLKQKDLLPLTGYVHGGCSPVGMKKQFKTVIHDSALGLDAFYVSAGHLGYQVELDPQALASLIGASFGDVAVQGEPEE